MNDSHNEGGARKNFEPSAQAGQGYAQGGYGYGQSAQEQDVRGNATTSNGPPRGQDRFLYDDHYKSWRDQQLAQHDRDYEEYRNHKQNEFHSDFERFRQSRVQTGESQDARRNQGTHDHHPDSTSGHGAAHLGQTGQQGSN
jgi:hypothetical protein